jgi:tRNA-splicing ligase RtcB
MFKFKEDKMKVPCYVWAEKEDIEQGAIDQIKNLSELPFVFHHTALMPDAHQGYGVSIGSVFATRGVIIPNAVGVDIGCGMCAVKTSLTEIDTETLKKIMGEIRKVIPVGFNRHKEEQDERLMPDKSKYEYGIFADDFKVVYQEYKNALKSLGTLGGGNHFIEIQKGSDGYIWIMIHSGSRNLGKQVADHYNKVAKELNKKWYSSVPEKYDLAFLPIDSKEGQAYIREMNYCVEFALANRRLMMERIKDIFKKECMPDYPELANFTFEPMINIAHNYASMENHFGENVMVHRKGATLARKDTIGTIPGSQGTKSYIVKGKGNLDSFQSCSHGAGRKMSRSKAEKELNLEEEIKKLDDQGIIHAIRGKKDLDEASGAYKSIDVVMKNQKDLVEVLVELTPLAVIKG